MVSTCHHLSLHDSKNSLYTDTYHILHHEYIKGDKKEPKPTLTKTGKLTCLKPPQKT